MTIDSRQYVSNDKRHPVSLSGDAGKVLVVNSAEDGYETAAFSGGHHNDIIGGDATIALNTLTFTPCGAWDSTRLVYLETTEDKDVDLPSTVSLTQIKYYLYLVRLVADGTCEFRAYLSKTGANSPEEDTEVSHFRYRVFWRTFTDGTAVLAALVGSYLTFGKSSQCISTVTLSVVSFSAVDHSDLLDTDVVELIQYGVKSSIGADVFVYTSLDGSNHEHRLLRGYVSNTDVTDNSWGYAVGGGFYGLIPYTAVRKFLANYSPGTGLLFKAVKMRL